MGKSELISLLFRQAALAFGALLPLVNPVGSALILLSMVGPAPAEVYKGLARRIAIFTVVFFVVVELVGEALLRFFGISLPVVQLAGGLVLASLGWQMLNQQESGPAAEKQMIPEQDYSQLKSRAFYPYTFPLTVGPGCMVVMLTLSVHASRPGTLPDTIAHAGIFLAAVLLAVCVYFCYGYAQKLTKRVSAETLHGVLRIMAFILFCIGVQIAWNGTAALLRTLKT